MSITPTAVVRSVSPRPYAGVLGARLPISTSLVPASPLQAASFGDSWVGTGHMSAMHNPTTVGTNGSKRLGPGSLSGVLT